MTIDVSVLPETVFGYGACGQGVAANFRNITDRVIAEQRAAQRAAEKARQAQAVVLDWCYGFYNHDRRHSAAGMMSPINYENTAAPDREAA